MSEPLLEFDRVAKTFPRFTLGELSLAAPAGAITGLVGANGAGKSTLMRLALGLLRPDRGRVRVFGQDPRQAALRARIGFVQESPSPWGALPVADLGRVLAPFYPRWDAGRFRQLCRRFELPAATRFDKLSQGSRMKTALALALTHGAELLLLDEPSGGLDPLARRDLLDLLLEVVQDEGRAVLFSTHITSDLDRIADHVVMLDGGQVRLAGSKEALQDAWVLVKGSDALLRPEVLEHCAGGVRGPCGVDLLCHDRPALRRLLPAETLVQRPGLEDLLYFHGRALEDPCTA
jgi:ABC-2 type transport system ATP-binding protein